MKTAIRYAAPLLVFVLLTGTMMVRLKPIPARTFSVPYRQIFAFFKLSDWQVLSGTWEVKDNMLVQSRVLGTDLIAAVPLTLSPHDYYYIRATMRRLSGSMGGGLVFNLGQVSSHMIRFSVEGTGKDIKTHVMFGYFDDNGVYQGQGNVVVDLKPDDTNLQTLGVLVGPDGYRVRLNGRTISETVPVLYHSGKVGLITTASSVGFESFSVDFQDF